MTWNELLQNEYKQEYYQSLFNFVKSEYQEHTVYPPPDKIMNALDLTPYDNVKCVILGQDPYHGPNQAMGLSFSVPAGVTIPPSLRNIYLELQNEFGYELPNHGDLTAWAKDGVLLLNSVLTVRAKSPTSHQNKGWEIYTDAIIRTINNKPTPVVFLLWGNFARSKRALITNPNHLILEAPHPSPFSANRGFFGCNHFKQCNDFLQKQGLVPINWKIKNK